MGPYYTAPPLLPPLSFIFSSCFLTKHHLPFPIQSTMAFKNLTPNTLLFFLLLFSTLLPLLPKQGICAQSTLIHPHLDSNLIPKDLKQEGFWRWREKSARRLMIGSIAPTCTFNECRGCRFRCRAEQVPVDANDPVNSAYRYRCVCHR